MITTDLIIDDLRADDDSESGLCNEKVRNIFHKFIIIISVEVMKCKNVL